MSQEVSLEEYARAPQVSRLLTRARRRTRAADHPELAEVRFGRRFAHLSQDEVALVAGVPVGWYAMLERGWPTGSRSRSADRLERLAWALALSPDEHQLIQDLIGVPASDRAPADDAAVRPKRVIHGSALLPVMRSQPWPVAMTDGGWRFVAANAAMARWFPAVSRHNNLLRMLLTDPATREQLVDWERGHAPHLVAQLRAAITAEPSSRRLRELVADVLAHDEVLNRLWRQVSTSGLLRADPRVVIQVPGAPAATTVEVIAMRPDQAPHLTTYSWVPIGGYDPAGVLRP